jgi:sugar phosphate permease
LILVAPVMVLAAGLGYVICRSSGWAVHERELLIAMVIGIVAGEAAFVPAMLAGRETADVAQAGLGGTVIHMLLMGGLTVAAVALKLATDPMALVWWVLVFYWVSLALVAAGYVSLVRSAARGGGANRRESNGSSMQ